MADIAVQTIVPGGLTPAAAAAASAGGDKFLNDGRVLFEVVNTSGANRTVTVNSIPTVVEVPGMGNLATPDDVKVIANGARAFFGPYPPARYNDAAGKVSLTYDNQAGLAIQVLRLPPIPS